MKINDNAKKLELQNMQEYEEPVLQLLFFAGEDILTVSVSGDQDAEGDFWG